MFLKQGNRNVLLSDLGFGYTQLLPVIMKIALAGHSNLADVDEIMSGAYEGEQPYYSNFFVLQEPEGNLHPSFQTKIADLIVEANKKFNIRFVIETHSEYLIRKLQYLTATNKLSVNDTSILYFHQKDSSDYLKSLYRTIRILENGRLSMPFGEGFFDEADRIAFELYRLKLIDN
jgi:predicted ATP-dependent endonuclease of OLD family